MQLQVHYKQAVRYMEAHLGDEVGGPPLDGVSLERRVRPLGRARVLALRLDAGRDQPRAVGSSE